MAGFPTLADLSKKIPRDKLQDKSLRKGMGLDYPINGKRKKMSGTGVTNSKRRKLTGF